MICISVLIFMIVYVCVLVVLDWKKQYMQLAMTRTIADGVVIIIDSITLFWLRVKMENINNESLKDQIISVKRQFLIFLLAFVLLMILDILDYFADHVVEKEDNNFVYQLSLRVSIRVLMLVPMIYVM